MSNNLDQHQTLNKWAEFTIQAWLKRIAQLHIGSTGEAAQSFVNHITDSAGGDVQKIEFAFKFYLVFVDMGVGKGVKIGDVKSNSLEHKLTGSAVARHAKRWQNKTFSHQVYTLQEIIADKYLFKAQLAITEGIIDKIEL